ncbi:MAG: hypothetical protein WCB79_10285 [Halobacteriota archaeon]
MRTIYMLMGVKHGISAHDPFSSPWTQNVPSFRVEGAFGEWRRGNGSGQRHNSVEGLSLTI